MLSLLMNTGVVAKAAQARAKKATTYFIVLFPIIITSGLMKKGVVKDCDHDLSIQRGEDTSHVIPR